MASREEMVKRLSGGASESDPNNSLGGVMSSVQIDSQSGTYVGGGIAGVTILEALGHQIEGNGTLAFTFSTTSLTWNPPGAGGTGIAVDVSPGDGTYLIASSTNDEYLLVDVVNASLPGSDTNDSVDVAFEVQNLFDAVGGVEAALGSVKYRCFYVLNDGAGNALNVKVWITRQPAESNTLIAIGLDPVGIGDGSATGVATTIVDEDTAPAGVSFSTPVTEGTALMIGNLSAGEVQAVWVRRTVPVNEMNESDADPSEITIGVSF